MQSSLIIRLRPQMSICMLLLENSQQYIYAVTHVQPTSWRQTNTRCRSQKNERNILRQNQKSTSKEHNDLPRNAEKKGKANKAFRKPANLLIIIIMMMMMMMTMILYYLYRALSKIGQMRFAYISSKSLKPIIRTSVQKV